MARLAAALTAGLVAFACAGSLQAHHSGYMYESTPIWVRGAVVSFERVGPHSLITLEDRSQGGQVRRWVVEGPSQVQLDRMGVAADIVKVGDVLQFCAFPYKSVAELSRMFPGADFSTRRALRPPDGESPQFVAGHVMVKSDGQRQFWEPHGVIAECMRSSGDRRQWLALLNSNAGAREAWCEQRRYAYVRSNPSLLAYIDEIDGALDRRCQ